MGVFQSLPWAGWIHGRQLVDAVAEQVAQRSRGSVAGRLSGKSAKMSKAQRRGYIRARASQIVRRELLAVVAREFPRLSADQQQQALESAMQRVVDQAVAKTIAGQKFPLRIAA